MALLIPIFCTLWNFLIQLKFLTVKVNFDLWNTYFLKIPLFFSFGYPYLCHLMSRKQIWLYKFLQLEVSNSSYSSSLFGLMALKQQIDPKTSKKYLFEDVCPSGLCWPLMFFCNPWCLIRPLVPEDKIFHQYFITKRKWMRFGISVHCDPLRVSHSTLWCCIHSATWDSYHKRPS